MTKTKGRAGRFRFLPRLALLVPLLVVFSVPFYNAIEPALGGVPFFYWYQLAWVLIGAVIVIGLYLIERRTGLTDKAADSPEAGHPGETL